MVELGCGRNLNDCYFLQVEYGENLNDCGLFLIYLVVEKNINCFKCNVLKFPNKK